MSGDVLPKKNVSVIVKDKDNNWKRYDIISRAGKATGKYANHLNIFDKNEKKGYSLDWKNNIVEWREAVSEEVSSRKYLKLSLRSWKSEMIMVYTSQLSTLDRTLYLLDGCLRLNNKTLCIFDVCIGPKRFSFLSFPF